MVDKCSRIDIIYHQIQITVIVQIGVCRTTAIRLLSHAPISGLVGKIELAIISENIIFDIRRGHFLYQFQHISSLKTALFGCHKIVHVFQKIEVGVVVQIAICDV